MPFDEMLGARLPPPAGRPQAEIDRDVRKSAIYRDILNRHQVPEVPSYAGPGLTRPATPQEAFGHISSLARSSGNEGYGNAWESPSQRQQAMDSYMRGGSGRELRSQYLMSPQDAAFHGAYGRDLTFLHNLVDPLSAETLERWDRNHDPVHRSGLITGANTYQNSGSNALSSSVANLFEGDTEHPVSGVFHRLGWVPHTINIALSGDASPQSSRHSLSNTPANWGDAGRQAWGYLAQQAATKLHNPTNQSPVNVGPYSGEDGKLAYTHSTPVYSAQRYGEQYGFVPPGWLTDSVDLLGGAADETLFLAPLVRSPLLKSARGTAARGAETAAARAAMLGAAKQDAAQDAAVSHAINGAAGVGRERTWPEYLLGGRYEGPVRSPLERELGVEARRDWYQRSGGRLSNDLSEVYRRQERDGVRPTYYR